MKGRPLTDAQLAAGLRAHLPSRAAAGLRERITAEIVATPQVRRFPWALGLGDADPIVHRRALLLVALLGLLAATSVAAVAGAWLRAQDQAEDLSRSTEVDAFVLESYRGLTGLPAFRLAVREGLVDTPDAVTHYSYDGVGLLREESGGRVLLSSRDFTAWQESVASKRVWVLGDGDGHAIAQLEGRLWVGPTNCATGWESLGTAELIGRSTRHVRCTTVDARQGTLEFQLWIDIESGLPMRTRSGSHYQDVTLLEFGPQATDQFVLEGEAISSDEFACATEGLCASPGPSPSEAPATAVASPPPAPDIGVAPADLDAFVADVHAAYERTEPVDIRLDMSPELPLLDLAQWQRDGLGNYRAVQDAGQPAIVWLTIDGHSYETDPRPDGRVWRDWGQPTRYGTSAPIMGLPTGCGFGWTYLGDDLVLDRPAAHIGCGLQEFWIDREWMLVTRAHDHDPMLGDNPGAGLSRVISVSSAPQPAELFAPPSTDSIWQSY